MISGTVSVTTSTWRGCARMSSPCYRPPETEVMEQVTSRFHDELRRDLAAILDDRLDALREARLALIESCVAAERRASGRAEAPPEAAAGAEPPAALARGAGAPRWRALLAIRLWPPPAEAAASPAAEQAGRRPLPAAGPPAKRLPASLRQATPSAPAAAAPSGAAAAGHPVGAAAEPAAAPGPRPPAGPRGEEPPAPPPSAGPPRAALPPPALRLGTGAAEEPGVSGFGSWQGRGVRRARGASEGHPGQRLHLRGVPRAEGAVRPGRLRPQLGGGAVRAADGRRDRLPRARQQPGPAPGLGALLAQSARRRAPRSGGLGAGGGSRRGGGPAREGGAEGPPGRGPTLARRAAGEARAAAGRRPRAGPCAGPAREATAAAGRQAGGAGGAAFDPEGAAREVCALGCGAEAPSTAREAPAPAGRQAGGAGSAAADQEGRACTVCAPGVRVEGAVQGVGLQAGRAPLSLRMPSGSFMARGRSRHAWSVGLRLARRRTIQKFRGRALDRGQRYRWRG
ncbi:unnamed protein product [Prorocentrum cordatum]|uniref:Uncharacterized protein n=1 Tax=Prorocentrum cordatum TaxID=2364126 RepID=A0ABN9SVE7_9DINO|nr:unnamed protein product [Polarella glacialis]